MSRCRMLATALCFLFASVAVAATPLGDKPGGALSLQATFDKGVAVTIGPAPVRQDADGATWKAGDVLSSAQGAVSFRIRIPKQDRPRAELVTLMSLAGTRAGEWQLGIAEGPEPKKPDKAKPPEDLPHPERGPVGAEAPSNPESPLEPKKEPVGEFQCQVSLKFFAEGSASGKTVGKVPVFGWNEWHQVVWTWRSVNHAIYIDGVPCAAGLHLSRLQPIADPEAVFKVAAGKAEMADLRVFRQALDPDEAAALSKAQAGQHLPAPAPLRLWADWGLATGRAVVYADAAALPAAAKVELACVEAASGKVLLKATMAALPSGLGEVLVKVTEPERFPPGTYRFEGVAFDAAGKEVARGRTPDWTAVDLKEPWLGCRAGMAPKVLPPFTPIEVEKDRVRTVLREHTVDRAGLFKSVVAAGGELLASPVRLDVTSGGKPLVFSGGPGLKKIENRGEDAEWAATTVSPEGHALRVDGHMEYDGLARFDMTLTPKGKLDIERAELIVPYRPETLRLIHSVASGFINRFLEVAKEKDGRWAARYINWDTYAPKEPKRREGVVFDSNDLHHAAEVARYRFVPYLHAGNDNRGLAWFADNDQGWLHDPAQVPTMEVVATDAEKLLRLNVVARAATLTEPLHVRFYLLANPFKPMPKDWRTWEVADARKNTEFQRAAPFTWWWHWNEYARSFVPYPGGVQGKKYEDWLGKFKEGGVTHAPFVNFGVPSDSGLYGPPYFNEMAVLPYSWKLHNNRPLQDYMVYWLDKCATEIGIRGVYVDEPYCDIYSYNILAGDAPYLRADGTRAVGYRFLEGRAYFRRIKQMFAEHGQAYSLWVHTTNYKVSPVLTFVDISMDGEHPMIWVPAFDNYHVFYNATRSRGYLSGLGWGFVGSQMFHGNTDPKTFPGLWTKSRTYLAVTLPNQVLPQTAGIPGELERIENVWTAFGIADDGLEELPLAERAKWLPGLRPEPDGLQVGGTLNRKRGQALLYATAPWKGTRFELAGGLKSLALGKPHNHAWNAETGASLPPGDKTLLDFAFPGDLAVLLVRGADRPQAPRPDGVLLGVSFDSGTEPDFGGGMAPVAVAGEAPAMQPGTASKALALSYGRGALGYPVVPSWVEGSVEMDVQLGALGRSPLRLLAMEHHLDVSLSYAERDGRKGLLLIANEIRPQEKLDYVDKQLPIQKREAFMPVPAADAGAWNRVTLVWRAGQYDLYWNEKRLGGIHAPAAARLRDAIVMAPGVWIGDATRDAATAGKADAAVDSVLVYDWALRPEDVGRRAAMSPAARPPRDDTIEVSVSGEKLTEAWASLHLGRYKDWEKVTAVKFTLFDGKQPAAPLGTATATPWLGTALARLALTAPTAPMRSGGVGESAAGDAMADLEVDRDVLLQVELYHDKDVLATRKVPAKIGVGGAKM